MVAAAAENKMPSPQTAAANTASNAGNATIGAKDERHHADKCYDPLISNGVVSAAQILQLQQTR
jgi:hypothetical protein